MTVYGTRHRGSGIYTSLIVCNNCGHEESSHLTTDVIRMRFRGTGWRTGIMSETKGKYSKVDFCSTDCYEEFFRPKPLRIPRMR